MTAAVIFYTEVTPQWRRTLGQPTYQNAYCRIRHIHANAPCCSDSVKAGAQFILKVQQCIETLQQTVVELENAYQDNIINRSTLKRLSAELKAAINTDAALLKSIPLGRVQKNNNQEK